jgi:hypothetical protein
MTLLEKLWARLGASAQAPDSSPALARVSWPSASLGPLRLPCRAVLSTMPGTLLGSFALALALGVR